MFLKFNLSEIHILNINANEQRSCIKKATMIIKSSFSSMVSADAFIRQGGRSSRVCLEVFRVLSYANTDPGWGRWSIVKAMLKWRSVRRWYATKIVQSFIKKTNKNTSFLTPNLKHNLTSDITYLNKDVCHIPSLPATVDEWSRNIHTQALPSKQSRGVKFPPKHLLAQSGADLSCQRQFSQFKPNWRGKWALQGTSAWWEPNQTIFTRESKTRHNLMAEVTRYLRGQISVTVVGEERKTRQKEHNVHRKCLKSQRVGRQVISKRQPCIDPLTLTYSRISWTVSVFPFMLFKRAKGTQEQQLEFGSGQRSSGGWRLLTSSRKRTVWTKRVNLLIDSLRHRSWSACKRR